MAIYLQLAQAEATMFALCRKKQQAPVNGVQLEELPQGAVLEVKTGNRTYVIEKTNSDQVLISGHPQHCPEPVLANLCGVGAAEGACLQYLHPDRGIIRTSRVRQIRALGSRPSLATR
jgi:hypothetical protein